MTHSCIVVYRKKDGKIINFIDYTSEKEGSSTQTPIDLEINSTEMEKEARDITTDQTGEPKAELATLLVAKEDINEQLDYKVDLKNKKLVVTDPKSE